MAPLALRLHARLACSAYAIMRVRAVAKAGSAGLCTGATPMSLRAPHHRVRWRARGPVAAAAGADPFGSACGVGSSARPSACRRAAVGLDGGLAAEIADAPAGRGRRRSEDAPEARFRSAPATRRLRAAAERRRAGRRERRARRRRRLRHVGKDAGAALIRFAQERGASAVMTGKLGKRVRNVDFVVAKPVVADAALWQPMQTAAGRGRLLFDGRRPRRLPGRGEPSGRRARPRRRRRPDAHGLRGERGVADPSTLLEYAEPEAHLRALRALRADARTPRWATSRRRSWSSVAAWRRCRSRSRASRARRPPWARTKRFLNEMSALTADAVEAHADAELARVGAGDHFRELTGGWREHVV